MVQKMEMEGKKQPIKKDLLIIMPAYNEEKNIRQVLEQLNSQEITNIADVLVMNDGSSDSTNWIVKEYHHTLVTHVFNLGYGSAIQLGYKYAIRRKYKYVIQMDSDGQHDVCNIPIIYQKLKQQGEDGRYPDIILGSRYLLEDPNYQTSCLKKIAYSYFRYFIRLFTGRQISDPTTGLQGLSRKAVLYCSRYNHFDDRYPDANIVIQMILLGFKVEEIPAKMHIRSAGKSMHSGLKPVVYMVRMTMSILAVVYRVKVLKKDAGIGKNGIYIKE